MLVLLNSIVFLPITYDCALLSNTFPHIAVTETLVPGHAHQRRGGTKSVLSVSGTYLLFPLCNIQSGGKHRLAALAGLTGTGKLTMPTNVRRFRLLPPTPRNRRPSAVPGTGEEAIKSSLSTITNCSRHWLPFIDTVNILPFPEHTVQGTQLCLISGNSMWILSD